MESKLKIDDLEKAIRNSKKGGASNTPVTVGRLIECLMDYYDKMCHVSASEFAKKIGISRTSLYKIINENNSIKPETAIKLGKATNTPPDLWWQLHATSQQVPESVSKVEKYSLTEYGGLEFLLEDAVSLNKEVNSMNGVVVKEGDVDGKLSRH